MKTYPLYFLAVLASLTLVGCRAAATSPQAASPTVGPTLANPPSSQATSPEVTRPACAPGKAESLFYERGGVESVAVARDSVVYTATVCSGTVYRLDAGGESTALASIPFGVNNSSCGAASALGVAVSDDGGIWVVVASGVPQSHGIWRIGEDGSKQLAIPMDPNLAPIPNDLVFGSNGTLYVTESKKGAIWRATPGGTAEPWLQSDLLAPGQWGQFGANGIAFRDDALYVGNFDKGFVLQIPVGSDRSPGSPVVVAKELPGIDGIDFDPLGRLYGVSATWARLVRILPAGNSDIVLDLSDMGMPYPSGIAFAPDGDDSSVVYIADMHGKASIIRLSLCPPNG